MVSTITTTTYSSSEDEELSPKTSTRNSYQVSHWIRGHLSPTMKISKGDRKERNKCLPPKTITTASTYYSSFLKTQTTNNTPRSTNSIVCNYTQRFGALRGSPVVLLSSQLPSLSSQTTTSESTNIENGDVISCCFDYRQFSINVQQQSMNDNDFRISTAVYRATHMSDDENNNKSSIVQRVAELNRMLTNSTNGTANLKIGSQGDIVLSLTASIYHPKSAEDSSTSVKTRTLRDSISAVGSRKAGSTASSNGATIRFEQYCILLDHFLETTFHLNHHLMEA